MHSAREYFHTYLQSLDVERAGLPETFQGRLQRVLGHYGVAGLERTPELEEAVFRIFLAQQRASADVAIVSALLRQWLTEAPPAESLREQAGLALEHLIAATQVRYPSVSDLARGVVFRWFAQPLLRRARAEAYAGVRQSLRHLDRNPDSPDRAERIAAMVAVSEPLVRLLGQRIGRPGTDPAPLLEVMTRRYYGSKGLSGIRSRDVAGCTFVTAEHVEPARVVTTAVDFAQLADAVRGRRRAGRGRPGRRARGRRRLRAVGRPARRGRDGRPPRRGDHGAAAARACRPDHRDRRGGRRRGDAPPLHLPPRRRSGFAEDRLIRGLHPRVAERMQLERLREFDLTRLPSADEEVYLFKCVAQANPADERLVAMAQVRDLTPLREADGRLAALPAAEDALAACLDAIRNVQAQRPAKQRFDTNRDRHLRLAAGRAVDGRAEPDRRSACCRPRPPRAWRRCSSWPGAATRRRASCRTWP